MGSGYLGRVSKRTLIKKTNKYNNDLYLILNFLTNTHWAQYDEPDSNKSQKAGPKTPTELKVIQLRSRITIHSLKPYKLGNFIVCTVFLLLTCAL